MTDKQKQTATDFAEVCAATIEICRDLAQPTPAWATEWLSQFNRWNDRENERCAAAVREADDAMKRISEQTQARFRAEAEIAAELTRPKEDPRLRYWKENSIA
jgi:hypothetical protein